LETAAFFCLWLCMSPLEDCRLLRWSGALCLCSFQGRRPCYALHGKWLLW
jgi:hypothetical protein